jgi:hypothetical protein
MADASTLKIGGRYNWRNQPERLIYMGMCEPRNGRWHQFALVEKPHDVWCEVHPSDLPSIEETASGVNPSSNEQPKDTK